MRLEGDEQYVGAATSMSNETKVVTRDCDALRCTFWSPVKTPILRSGIFRQEPHSFTQLQLCSSYMHTTLQPSRIASTGVVRFKLTGESREGQGLEIKRIAELLDATIKFFKHFALATFQ